MSPGWFRLTSVLSDITVWVKAGSVELIEPRRDGTAILLTSGATRVVKESSTQVLALIADACDAADRREMDVAHAYHKDLGE